MIRNTVLYIIGLLILGSLGYFITIDYWWFVTGQPTVSNRVHEFLLAHSNQPILYIFIGVMIGLGVGVVLGTILGHLFWP